MSDNSEAQAGDDDPLREVQGEFFRREDHERILALERDLAYRCGFADGQRSVPRAPVSMVVRSRGRFSIGRAPVRLVMLLVVVAYLLELAGQA